MAKKSGAWQAFALVGQIGLNMLVPIVLCIFAGRWLDNKLGTSYFLFIFIILGIITAYKSLFDVTKRWRKEDHEQMDEAKRGDDGFGDGDH